MKRIVLSLFALITISSCEVKRNRDAVVGKDNFTVPTEVKKMMDNNIYDTMYVIQTEDMSYVFDKNKEPVMKVNNDSGDSAKAVVIFFLVVVILLILFL